MPKDAILLTGATGFIGQYVLYDLLRQGREVAVLVRPRRRHTAEDRLERRIRDWENRLGVNLVRPLCFSGDLRHEQLGLGADDRAWLRRNVDTMLHVAALVEFSNKGTTIWDTNVTGTENCLDVCRSARIGQLHYVSTAYVCGDYPMTFYEDQLECEQQFRNEYEHSKFAAETMVRQSAIADQTTVYRPAVVVGDSQTGFATSFRGFYVLAQFTHLIAQHAQRDQDGRWHHPLRFDKVSDEPRNLVPVDWVAQVIDRVFSTPALHGRTYHIAPTIPVTAAEIEAALRAHFGFYGVDLVGPEGVDQRDSSGMQAMFFEYINKYLPYWNDEPSFDLTNTKSAMAGVREPRVGVEELTRMIEHAVKTNFGKRTRRRELATC